MVIPHRYRSGFIFTFDVVLACLAVPVSLALRVGLGGVAARFELMLLAAALMAGIAAVTILASRHDRISWRWVSIDDAILLCRSALFINLAFLAALFMTTRLDGLPRSFVGINILVLSGFYVGSRLLFRLWHERQPGFARKPSGLPKLNVLLVGATDEAESFIRKMSRNAAAPYNVLGIVNSSDERPIGSRIRGVKIVGGLSDISKLLAGYRKAGEPVAHLILADRAFKGEPIGDLLDLAEQADVRLSRLPELSQLQSAETGRITVQPINVEDLLSRPQARLDSEAMTLLLEGKRVLVTGAGGSIGSELVRQIAAVGPSRLALVDASEFNLYEIEREIAEAFPDIERTALLVNVRDREHIFKMFAEEKPDIVFHAAALKHVPLLEPQAAQAVLTNVLGTRNVADAAIAQRVQKMVMISTDKAAQPVSVMGASKRIAETYCQACDIRERKRGGTRFVTVRFGNVLGSAGSVVPLFQKQLERGGPLTVTDPRMTRYFMTIREAVELVLQASALKDAAIEEAGAIVVLDMGEPVKIVDMARQMIRLAGFHPGKDIEIVYTGLRPGERLYETLFQNEEELVHSSHDAILVARPRVADEAFVDKILGSLTDAAIQSDDAKVRRLMERMLPDFAAGAGVQAEAESDIAEDPSA